ncbi:MAG: hypothetical protein U5N10_17490 [Gemmobacter sp.]|nr:hypothetical protein [Gemmobacter sp.]
MTGQIALFIRLLLPVAGWLAGTGLVAYDEAAGTLAVSLDDLAQGLAGLVLWAATVAWSRVAKARGGVT